MKRNSMTLKKKIYISELRTSVKQEESKKKAINLCPYHKKIKINGK